MDIGPQEIIIIVLIIVVLFGITWAAKNKNYLKRPGSTDASTKDKESKG